MPDPKPTFGIDAPPVIAVFGGIAVLGFVLLFIPPLLVSGVIFLVIGVATDVLMLHSSRRGKILERDRVLDRLGVRDGETVLDLGCGSGLMLLGAVDRGPRVTGIGVDLWRGVDQAGSNRETCTANARLLGVEGRIELIDGDMSDLPMEADSVDLVLACVAIHNIHDADKRRRTIDEAARVLRPGGRLAIIDFTRTGEYAANARAAGFADVARSGMSLRMYPPVRVVTARMP